MFKVYRGNPIGEFGGKSTILSISIQCPVYRPGYFCLPHTYCRKNHDYVIILIGNVKSSEAASQRESKGSAGCCITNKPTNQRSNVYQGTVGVRALQ